MLYFVKGLIYGTFNIYPSILQAVKSTSWLSFWISLSTELTFYERILYEPSDEFIEVERLLGK